MEIEDTALTLRKRFDNKEDLRTSEIEEMLENSLLVQKLTADFIEKPLFAVWRIIALAEIPYTSELDYTKKVMSYIDKYLTTSVGFVITGQADDLVPCYNAMLIEAYCKLGCYDNNVVAAGIDWIKNYLLLERDRTSEWKGKGVTKYGGCLKTTPCFIGIVKSIKALVVYRDYSRKDDEEIVSIIDKGMSYILKHNLYQRLSNRQPINTHILDLAFPPSYQLNIVEILELAYLTNNLEAPECLDAFKFLKSKVINHEYWKVNYIYRAPGYLSFNGKRDKDNWITYLITKFISN